MKIISWMSVLTAHQAHTYRCLETLSGEPIEYVLGARAIHERSVQGWTAMDLGGMSVHELPARHWWQFGKNVIDQYPEAIHIFNGMWSDRRFFPLLVYAQSKSVVTCLTTEPYADAAVSYFGDRVVLKDRLKPLARRWIYRLAGYFVGRNMKAVFAISRKATTQFEEAGFNNHSIFPFGYFVPRDGGGEVGCAGRNDAGVDEAPGRLKLVFIGNLIPRKGLKTLLDAVDISVSKGALITLEVYGPGDRGTVDAHGGFAYYCGQIPFGQSQNVIRNYDLLVVPSLHDGWAVVVNEALLQGIPVICSDAVGARVLVEASGAGQTFAASDADALASLLLELSQQPEKLKKWRLNAERFSDSLSPQVAAQYQMDCLDFITGRSTSRPSAPWYA